MTVASRAVMMTVMTDVRMMTVMTDVRMMGMLDVEQEGHTSHWHSTMATSSPARSSCHSYIGQNEYVFPCVHILAVATVLHLHVNILEVLELMLHAE